MKINLINSNSNYSQINTFCQRKSPAFGNGTKQDKNADYQDIGERITIEATTGAIVGIAASLLSKDKFFSSKTLKLIAESALITTIGTEAARGIVLPLYRFSQKYLDKKQDKAFAPDTTKDDVDNAIKDTMESASNAVSKIKDY